MWKEFRNMNRGMFKDLMTSFNGDFNPVITEDGSFLQPVCTLHMLYHVGLTECHLVANHVFAIFIFSQECTLTSTEKVNATVVTFNGVTTGRRVDQTNGTFVTMSTGLLINVARDPDVEFDPTTRTSTSGVGDFCLNSLDTRI
jgi:hypothetical protein